MSEETTSKKEEQIFKHSINRPPKLPRPALGPYFQFLTTDKKIQWPVDWNIFKNGVEIFFSCNGFDARISKEHALHLNSIYVMSK